MCITNIAKTYKFLSLASPKSYCARCLYKKIIRSITSINIYDGILRKVCLSVGRSNRIGKMDRVIVAAHMDRLK